MTWYRPARPFEATRLLLDVGATRADLYVTHMLSSIEDTTALCAAGISRIVSTDSVHHPTNAVRLAQLHPVAAGMRHRCIARGNVLNSPIAPSVPIAQS